MKTVAVTPPLQVLSDPASSLAAVTAAISEAERLLSDCPRIRVGIASNVTLDLLSTYLRRHALLEGLSLDIDVGGYDDVIGNLERYGRVDVDTVIVHSLFDNLLPSFEASLATLSDSVIAAKLREHRERLELALTHVSKVSRVILTRFHCLGRPLDAPGDGRPERVVADFNAMLEEVARRHANVVMVGLDRCVADVGIRRAFDWRFYFRAKAPYSIELLDELARAILARTRAFGTAYRKALVVDCDNTLWGGVVGEDTIQGIHLDPFDYPGNVYFRIQQEIVGLERQGVLICLASKNNPADVETALREHPNMVLRERDLAVKMLNWDSKDENLRRIASELNVGLDSLVFLDDSPFECELVRSQLPMVRVFQVPTALVEYPRFFDGIRAQFLAGGMYANGVGKTEQYRVRATAARERERFASHDEYLASLGMKVVFRRDAIESAGRIAELSQKSNQFNLTTRRYTEGQVRELMHDPAASVYSLHVTDKFGDSGLTGVAILRFQDPVAIIDSFLMSCRVIGRGVEVAAFEQVLAAAAEHGARTLEAEYIPTAKNAQVQDFFERMGMEPVDAPPPGRHYRTAIKPRTPAAPKWIEVTLA